MIVSSQTVRRCRLGCGLVALAAGAVVSARLAVRSRPPVVRAAFNYFPPYIEKGPAGTPVGFAAEIFAEAARRAKVNVRWVEIEGGADAALAQGKADIYPLATIRPGADAQFHMSAPWWVNELALVSTEARPIPDAAAAEGKTIASRKGVNAALSAAVFPKARLVYIMEARDMETALCSGKIDGFFLDLRLLQMQLLKRTPACSGQALSTVTVPNSRLYMGTLSTKQAARINDRIFAEIAKLAMEGALAQAASRKGIVTPYDTSRLKQALDAEEREKMMACMLAGVLVVLGVSIWQTIAVRRAKKEAEAAHARAQTMQYRFDQFMKHTPAITFIKDERRQVIYSNEELTGERIDCGRLCERDDDVFRSGQSVEVTETLCDQTGNERHFLVLKFPFSGAAGVPYLGGVALDVTARVRAERELEHHSNIDLLTGLPNRRSYAAELEKSLESDRRKRRGVAVCFMDLDGFKQVNDEMGHESGDELLRQVAQRLQETCRPGDMAARIGGDEFTFLLRDADAEQAESTMYAALRSLEEPFSIDGDQVRISASIGVSLAPHHGDSAPELIRKADAAMYMAKKEGKCRVQIWRGTTESLVALSLLGQTGVDDEYSLSIDTVS